MPTIRASGGWTSERSTATPASRCARRRQANAPQIAINATGAGAVVWQEPEISGIARIWARRLFGANLDYVLPASATSLDGAPIANEADAPSVAISLLGQADVAYRQASGPELAAVRAAHLPEHAARRRSGKRVGIHGRENRRPERFRRGGREDRCAQHRHRRTARTAADLRRQRASARRRGQRQRTPRQPSRSGRLSQAPKSHRLARRTPREGESRHG